MPRLISLYFLLFLSALHAAPSSVLARGDEIADENLLIVSVNSLNDQAPEFHGKRMGKHVSVIDAATYLFELRPLMLVDDVSCRMWVNCLILSGTFKMANDPQEQKHLPNCAS